MVSFRREKYVPRGGPNGGDGGKGGDVYLVADKNLATLYDFTHRRIFKAEDGEKGKTKNMAGKSGRDLFLKVPVGTVVKIQNLKCKSQNDLPDGKADKSKFKIGDGQNERETITDLTKHEQIFLVAQGGKGGFGNTQFKSSTNQAPREFTRGKLGEEKELVLELKLIADIGIIGLPNAGKSTLLNALTAAQAKVGEYPFTTLHPNLGVMEIAGRQIVLADIPGLIEGASRGKGLGDEFLRHIERTKVLVHLVDPLINLENHKATATNLIRQAVINYQIIQRELTDYSQRLLEKSEIVVVNKIDVTEVKKALSQVKNKLSKKVQNPKIPILAISAVTKQGLGDLKKWIEFAIKGLRAGSSVG